jgi:hypothetical protein
MQRLSDAGADGYWRDQVRRNDMWGDEDLVEMSCRVVLKSLEMNDDEGEKSDTGVTSPFSREAKW